MLPVIVSRIMSIIGNRVRYPRHIAMIMRITFCGFFKKFLTLKLSLALGPFAATLIVFDILNP